MDVRGCAAVVEVCFVVEVVVVIVVVISSVVVIGQLYSWHGHPFGQLAWQGHFSRLCWYSREQIVMHTMSAGGQLRTQALYSFSKNLLCYGP